MRPRMTSHFDPDLGPGWPDQIWFAPNGDVERLWQDADEDSVQSLADWVAAAMGW